MFRVEQKQAVESCESFRDEKIRKLMQIPYFWSSLDDLSLKSKSTQQFLHFASFPRSRWNNENHAQMRLRFEPSKRLITEE